METASRQLLAKFEAARALFERAATARVDEAAAQALGAELSALEIRFALSTGHLYIRAAAGEAGRQKALVEHARVLAAEDFAGSADRLVARGEAAFRAAGVALREEAAGRGPGGRKPARGRPVPSGAPAAAAKPGRETRHGAAGAAAAPRRAGDHAPGGRAQPPQVSADLQRLLDVYPRNGGPRGEGAGPAEGAAPRVAFEQCPACGGEMAVDAGRSEMRCGECGVTRELDGTVFDDAQFYSQEGQKAKSGTFNPNRHFQFWWVHILAREPEEEIGDKDDPDNHYGERVLAALRAIVLRDRKILRLLTVNDLRAMLREIERTDLNKNVPLLLKKLTGIGPPQLSDAIAVRVENLFTKAIEIGERVRRVGRVNRNYYPYYVGRLLEHILPEDDLENRRALYYIYVQSKETVEADDADWEMICLELQEVAYKPTDRSLGDKYRPS